MNTFPFDVWGKVAPTPAAGGIEMIKIVQSQGGGFLVITVEGGAKYDTWVETLEEVKEDLEALQVKWQPVGF